MWTARWLMALVVVALVGSTSCGGDDESVGPSCGDGLLDPGAECDDGNTIDGDGCDPLCRRESGADADANGDADADGGDTAPDGDADTPPDEGTDGTADDRGDSADDGTDDAGADDGRDSADDGTDDAGADDGTDDADADDGGDSAEDGADDAGADDGGDSAEDGADDAGADDGAVMVTLTGTVQELARTPIAGATLTVAENPSLVATSGADGSFTLVVPSETPLTLLVSCSGFVNTVVQTAILHTSVSTRLWMASPANYDLIVTSGGGTAADAAFYISLVVDIWWCDLTGSLITTEPPTGRVVYAGSDGLPDGSLTSLPSGSTRAFVVGPSGTTTPRINPTSCGMVPFPAFLGPVTVLGPVDVRPGSLHIMDIYVE